MRKTGTLYLLPNYIGDHTAHAVFPLLNIEVVKTLSHYVVENIKPARQLIRSMYREADIDNTTFFEMDKHRGNDLLLPEVMKLLEKGTDVGIISDAGCPGIADPGSDVVIAAHERNIPVVPLTGPSSILLTLMASGMNGQNFAFSGYLPKDQQERNRMIKVLESKVKNDNQTQLFIETPYRVLHLVEDLLKTVAPAMRLCIGAALHTHGQFIQTRTIAGWKSAPYPSLEKKQVVFALGR